MPHVMDNEIKMNFSQHHEGNNLKSKGGYIHLKVLGMQRLFNQNVQVAMEQMDLEINQL